MTQRDPIERTPDGELGGADVVTDPVLVHNLRLHREIVEKFGNLIDLDMGLADILRGAEHGQLVDDTGKAIDVAAGLADIIASDPAAMPDLSLQHEDPRLANSHGRTGVKTDVDLTHDRMDPADPMYRADVLDAIYATWDPSATFDDGFRLLVRTHWEFSRFQDVLHLLLDVRSFPRWREVRSETYPGGPPAGSRGPAYLTSRLLRWIDSSHSASLIEVTTEKALRGDVAAQKFSAVSHALRQQAELLAEQVLGVPLLFEDDGSLRVRRADVRSPVLLSNPADSANTGSGLGRPTRAEVHAGFATAVREGLRDHGIRQGELAALIGVSVASMANYLNRPEMMPRRWSRIVEVLTGAGASVEKFSRLYGAFWSDHPATGSGTQQTPREMTSLFVEALGTITLDFTEANLSGVDLSGLDLEGVLWSSRTRWPAGWKTRIEECSADLGEDLFEVRYGGALLGIR